MRRFVLLLAAALFCLNSGCTSKPAEQPRKLKAAIVPHDVIAARLAEDMIASLGDERPEKIFLVGPNHAAVGPKIISTHGGAAMLNGLAAANDELIQKEHSIGNVLPFLERHLPGVEVIPVIFHKAASLDAVKKVMGLMFAESGAVVVASIDFSHGLPPLFMKTARFS